MFFIVLCRNQLRAASILSHLVASQAVLPKYNYCNGYTKNRSTPSKPPKSLNYLDTRENSSLAFIRKNSKYKPTTYQPEKILSGASSSCTVSPETLKKKFVTNDYVKLITSISTKLQVNERTEILRLGVSNLVQFNKEELQTFLCFLIRCRTHSEQHLVEAVNAECARRLHFWSLATGLQTLDFLYAMSGREVFNTSFWNIFLLEWKKKSNTCSPEHAVQLLYYIGVSKQGCKDVLNSLEKIIEDNVTVLSSEELGIALEGFFKARHSISSSMIISTINSEVLQMLEDSEFNSHLVIRYLKTLRHARSTADNVIKSLSSRLSDGLVSKCSLAECGHYMATLGSEKHYDQYVLELMEQRILDVLVEEKQQFADLPVNAIKRVHPSKKSRPKDIKKLLWAFSELSYTPQRQHFYNSITKYLEDSLRNNYFTSEPEILLDCLHSLAVLGHYPRTLLQHILRFSSIDKLQDLKKGKVLKQLKTLLGSVRIEYPKVVPSSSFVNEYSDVDVFESIEDECRRRPCIDTFVRAFHDVSPQPIKPVRLLDHISISGFVFTIDNNTDLIPFDARGARFKKEHKKEVVLNENIIGNLLHNKRKSDCVSSIDVETKLQENERKCSIAVELADTAVCVGGSRKFTGLMDMKLRQLRVLGYKTVIIGPPILEALSNKTDSESSLVLKEFIVNAARAQDGNK